MRIEAIVVAGGAGRRMGGSVPKQFLELEGAPIIVHTLRALIGSGTIHRYIVVAPPDACQTMRTTLEAHLDVSDVVVVAGGAERQHSVYAGLQNVARDTDVVLVHDGVRPMISREATLRLVDAAVSYGAATLATRQRETLKRVQNGWVKATLDRENVWAVQTPQGFRTDVLLRAHQTARDEGYVGTDDASLVERVGHPVRIVEGPETNLKVTTPGDLAVAALLIRDSGGTLA